MIDEVTDGMITEEHDGITFVTEYTDGSLLDPNVDNFQRAGWGFFVAPDHAANVSKPFETSNPSVFRAELRAIMHAIQVCAIPSIIRTDCRAAFLSVQKIQNGQGYDIKHPEADILSVIAEINNTNCHIKWMPAHLDEDNNSKKRYNHF
jgi:ribonuclease HI